MAAAWAGGFLDRTGLRLREAAQSFDQHVEPGNHHEDGHRREDQAEGRSDQGEQAESQVVAALAEDLHLCWAGRFSQG